MSVTTSTRATAPGFINSCWSMLKSLSVLHGMSLTMDSGVTAVCYLYYIIRGIIMKAFLGFHFHTLSCTTVLIHPLPGIDQSKILQSSQKGHNLFFIEVY
jgi:hypothetical protein